MTVKPWLAPDIAESIRSGVPKPWLAPDLAQAITARRRKLWTPPDIAEDVDAIVDTGGGGGGPAWLPAGASLFIDTVNDHYYADGAERTKADLLSDNSPTEYGFTATALTAWSGSAWTTVIQTNLEATTFDLQYIPPPDEGTNGFRISGGVGGLWSFYDYNGPDSPTVSAGEGESSRIAVSANASTYSGSAVGGAIQTGVMGSPFPGNARGALTHIDPATDQIILIVYPTATADGDLPALSAL